MKNKIIKSFIIGTFVSLYLLVSIISTIHSINFFELSNPRWMAITLAIGFEVGAASSLASLIIMDRMNKTLVWSLFITITLMQINGNLYYAFINMQEYGSWVELFNLLEWEDLEQKRLLAAVSGAILPLIALGFIKSLVDYIKPSEDELISKDIAGFDDVVRDKDEYFEDLEWFGNLTEEELRDAEETLDTWRAEKLRGNSEKWDEDHIVDPALDADFGIEPWDVTLTDGSTDLEENEDWHSTSFNEPEEDEDLALEKALEQRAEEEKEEYLKNRANVKS